MTNLTFSVHTEFDPLSHVIIGTAEGHHRDLSQVAVVNSTQEKTVAASGHPSRAELMGDLARFKTALEDAGATVYEPALAPSTVQDQTCPRDIGFVIGGVFVDAGMRHASRFEEIAGIQPILDQWSGRRVSVPKGVALEGGDVVVNGACVFVGVGQRSDPEGPKFLESSLGPAYQVIPLPCRSLADGEEVLHLDCTFAPLGLGHALIYPNGLQEVPALIAERYDLIEVSRTEAQALATNVLSVAPDTLIARSGLACARVNAVLREAGYTVIEVLFDGVPSIGGSFRCATLPLRRV